MNDRCPGALHAVPARDGLLARIRIPGGMLSSAQLAALADLAERCGDGALDLTARANVQLRGLREETLAELRAGLLDADLLPSAAHDRVRNILTGAFAGLDPDELLDTRPLVRGLDAALLADAALAALPAKFGFTIDGGGAAPPDLGGSDLALGPARGTDDKLLLRLSIGGQALEEGVRPEDALSALLDAARAAIGLATSLDPNKRRWRLGALPGAEATIRAALARVLHPVTMTSTTRQATARGSLAPIGVWPTRAPELLMLVPSISLGRLDARQAHGIADLARCHRADLRIASWHGIVIGSVRRDALADIAQTLRTLGLPLDDADGYAGIVACAGSAGCTEALGDVRGLAAALARQRLAMRRRGLPDLARTINLAGCAKRCAMRSGADMEIVAKSSGYEVTNRPS